MSYMRDHYEAWITLLGKPHPVAEFMLKYGRDYPIGPDTYKGRRKKRKMCYENAAKLALNNSKLKYVEGKIACYGIPIDHAWCVDENGFVVDPTIRDNSDGHISNYFGVKFYTVYLAAAISLNDSYGLLDYFYAKRTAPKLYELGLENGQRWLVGLPLMKAKVLQ